MFSMIIIGFLILLVTSIKIFLLTSLFNPIVYTHTKIQIVLIDVVNINRSQPASNKRTIITDGNDAKSNIAIERK